MALNISTPRIWQGDLPIPHRGPVRFTPRPAFPLARTGVFLGIVLAYAAAPMVLPSEETAKKADRLVSAEQSVCEGETWPYVAQNCLSGISDQDRASQPRLVTVERRDPANRISVLIRRPATTVAVR